MARSLRRGVSSTKFTAERLEAFANDLKTQRVPLERQQISDDVVTGLRAVVYRTGRIVFHVSYHVDDKRPFMRIGELNKESPDYISIEEARDLAETIKALGEKGIDVQEGLERRLIRELKQKGTYWRVPK